MQLILKGSVPNMLARLAVPNVAAVAATTAVTFADVYFVGQIGTTALASLAIVFPFQTLMGMMSNGAIGGGVASSIIRALGGNNILKAENSAWHAIVIGIFMSLLYMVVLGMFSRPIFSLIIGPGDVLEGAVNYAQIIFNGAAIVWLAFMLSAILRGTGEMAIAANAINTICVLLLWIVTRNPQDIDRIIKEINRITKEMLWSSIGFYRKPAGS